VAREGSADEVVRPGRLALEVVKRLGRVVDPLEVLAVVSVSEVLVCCCEAFVLSSSSVAVGWGVSWVVAWVVCDVVVVATTAALPAALTPSPAKRKANRNVSNEDEASCGLRLPRRKISGRIIIPPITGIRRRI
jgi:hypothetical protein